MFCTYPFFLLGMKPKTHFFFGLSDQLKFTFYVLIITAPGIENRKKHMIVAIVFRFFSFLAPRDL